MKSSHHVAGYVDNAQYAQREDCDDRCDNCVHFVRQDRNSQCTKVENPINPNGWCEWYEESPHALDI